MIFLWRSVPRCLWNCVNWIFQENLKLSAFLLVIPSRRVRGNSARGSKRGHHRLFQDAPVQYKARIQRNLIKWITEEYKSYVFMSILLCESRYYPLRWGIFYFGFLPPSYCAGIPLLRLFFMRHFFLSVAPCDAVSNASLCLFRLVLWDFLQCLSLSATFSPLVWSLSRRGKMKTELKWITGKKNVPFFFFSDNDVKQKIHL